MPEALNWGGYGNLLQKGNFGGNWKYSTLDLGGCYICDKADWMVQSKWNHFVLFKLNLSNWLFKTIEPISRGFEYDSQ